MASKKLHILLVFSALEVEKLTIYRKRPKMTYCITTLMNLSLLAQLISFDLCSATKILKNFGFYIGPKVSLKTFPLKRFAPRTAFPMPNLTHGTGIRTSISLRFLS